MTDCPAPGIYPDATEAEYRGWDAVNYSSLKELARSPMHYMWALEHPKDPTPEMALGSAAHCLVLEPEQFPMRYIIPPKVDKRTRDGKAAFSAFEELVGQKIVIDADVAATASEIAKAVRESKCSKAVVDQAQHRELAIVWDQELPDEQDSVRCKARLDMMFSVEGQAKYLADLKTAASAHEKDFQRQMYNLKYYIQAGMYISGIEALGLGTPTWNWVVVENKPPHGVSLFRACGDVIEVGKSEFLQLLEQLQVCREAEYFPGYPEYPQSMSMPPWHAKGA